MKVGDLIRIVQRGREGKLGILISYEGELTHAKYWKILLISGATCWLYFDELELV
jgi:hypothetical protein